MTYRTAAIPMTLSEGRGH